MTSESDISVQGHGVHTAYVELVHALERRDDVRLIRGEPKRLVPCDVYHMHTIGVYMWRRIMSKNTKKIVSAHVIPDSFIGSIKLAKYWRFAAVWYMRWFYNRADKVLAVSGMVAQALREELGIAAEKIEVLYNTIDMSQYQTTDRDKVAARAALRLATKDFVVVGVGQVQPRKRIDVFVKMAHEMPDVTFIWVGGIPFKQLGADYKTMKRFIEQSPPNLIITDVIPHEKVKHYLQAADVFCLPAEQENHPMCVLEAAGVGLPLVVRDMPEYDDTFKNDAWRCTDETFTDAIKQLRENHKTYQLWQNNAKKIATRFDSKAAAQRLIDIYTDLVYTGK